MILRIRNGDDNNYDYDYKSVNHHDDDDNNDD